MSPAVALPESTKINALLSDLTVGWSIFEFQDPKIPAVCALGVAGNWVAGALVSSPPVPCKQGLRTSACGQSKKLQEDRND